MFQIKDEPMEFDDLSNFYTTKPVFNLEDILLNTFNDIDFNVHDEKTQINPVKFNFVDDKLSLENVLGKLTMTKFTTTNPTNRKPTIRHQQKQKPKQGHFKSIKQQSSVQVASLPKQPQIESQLLTDQLKEVYATLINCDCDWFKVDEEEVILNKLNKLTDDETFNLKAKDDLKRYRSKLNLRRLKRLKRLKCFDIDTYTNELIDSETNSNSHLQIETSPSNKNTSDIDIIAINYCRVLDRFEAPKKRKLQFPNIEDLYMVSIVEFRNDDVKCLISPYTNKILKPYIRRDFESWPVRLRLHKELHEVCLKKKLLNQNEINFERYSIDYVYLRPEHVLPINNLCRKYFWNGIDVSDCLQYPDYTCVALYRKIIIGFAFLVPNIATKEDYLSFILIHPNWRMSNIGKYMLYRLASINTTNDIILNVSVNSPAVLFYQKFGFKIEEYITQFYDKYYSDEENNALSKDAFLMRLAR